MLWSPESQKQWKAALNPADEIFYGGAAGGGKTDLLIGLATEFHQRSALFRRTYNNLKEIMRRTREVIGEYGDENKTDRTFDLKAGAGGTIEFGAVQFEDDKKNWQGRPHDLKGFDEITEFTESQYLFITGWTRTTNPEQRVRVVCTGNPPTDDVGSWVLRRWGPWLDDNHPAPAEAGELRWYANVDGEEVEFSDGEPREIGDETIYPRSRTFIPADLSDNPYYAHNTQYISTLQSLPEPLRSQLLHGDFTASYTEDPWQAIPTRWVRLAQQRWIDHERKKQEETLQGVGVDPSRGGTDVFAVCKRYDTFFEEVVKIPGRAIPDGPAGATRVQQLIGDEEPLRINIDIIGVGSSVFDSLVPVYQGKIHAINASSGSRYKDRTRKLKMRNLRAEYYWRMREALDPEHGDDIMLPPGQEVLADLCSARYNLTASGVLIQSKEEIKEKLGRSPDVGEAILLANYIPGKMRSIENPFYD